MAPRGSKADDRRLWAMVLAGGEGVRLRIEPFLDSEGEAGAVHQAYALMSRTSFSRAVLEPHPERLGVSRLPRVTWCDLGTPRRVLEVLARMRVRPAWAGRLEKPPLPDVPTPAPAVRSATAR